LLNQTLNNNNNILQAALNFILAFSSNVTFLNQLLSRKDYLRVKEYLIGIGFEQLADKLLATLINLHATG